MSMNRPEEQLQRPRRKYRNKPIVVDGQRFDSKKEAVRYGELTLLRKAGQISDLETQPRFPCVVNGAKVCDYYADFRYRTAAGAVVVEDVKSPATRTNPVYRLKKKLVEALHDVRVTEI